MSDPKFAGWLFVLLLVITSCSILSTLFNLRVYADLYDFTYRQDNKKN